MKDGEKSELQSKAEARYTVEAYYKGFRLLLTLPFENGGVIVGVLDKMAELGFTGERTLQVPQLPTAETAGNGNGKETTPNVCPVHGVSMKRYEKGNNSWFAHKDNQGNWCNGKRK